jgi:hypothetical protein
MSTFYYYLPAINFRQRFDYLASWDELITRYADAIANANTIRVIIGDGCIVIAVSFTH